MATPSVTEPIGTICNGCEFQGCGDACPDVCPVRRKESDPMKESAQAVERYEHDGITIEVLNSIKVGDLVKCNDWGSPMRVIAASKHYFLMARKAFGSHIYSVCEKKPADHSRNNYHKGYFRIGRDDTVLPDHHFDDLEWARSYLADFESERVRLSVRTAVDLTHLTVKRGEARK